MQDLIKIGNWKLPARRSLSAGGEIENSCFGKPKQAGFVLLFTILVSSIILLTALGISGISYRETILTSEASGGAEAFFAADTGIECAAYHYKKGNLKFSTGSWSLNTNTEGSAVSLNCNNESITNILDFKFQVGDTNNDCVKVDLTTDSSFKAVIESRGHNVPCGEVESNPRAVQRAIRVTY